MRWSWRGCARSDLGAREGSRARGRGCRGCGGRGRGGGEGTSGKAADQLPISRRNFIELCEELTAEDEKQFEDLWRQLGLSVDWSLTYRTIGDDAQRVAQRRHARLFLLHAKAGDVLGEQ